MTPEKSQDNYYNLMNLVVSLNHNCSNHQKAQYKSAQKKITEDVKPKSEPDDKHSM